MKTLKIILSLGLLGLPLVGFAQTKDFGWVVNLIVTKILTPLIGLLVVAAMLVFMWGLIKYLGGDAKNKEEAKGVMWFSVLAMFVMFSIWGLVNLLIVTFELNNESVPIPNIYP